jgi:hypothetical protein
MNSKNMIIQIDITIASIIESLRFLNLTRCKTLLIKGNLSLS